VQPCQAFAWNPSIRGSKVEDTIIAFDDHIEVLTATPDFPNISVEIDDHTYTSADILVR